MSALQGEELVGGQMTPLPGLQALCRDAGKRQPREAQYGRLGGFAEPPHLAILAFAQRHLDPRLVALDAQQAHGRGLRALAVQLDALTPALDALCVERALYLRDVHLRYSATRMLEHALELAVVREQEHSARVIVETPHRHDTRSGGAHERGDRCPALGVVQSRDDPARLVQHEVHERLGRDAPAVELHTLPAQIGLAAELAHDAPIHPHATRQDELFGLAPRGNSRAAQDLL